MTRHWWRRPSPRRGRSGCSSRHICRHGARTRLMAKWPAASRMSSIGCPSDPSLRSAAAPNRPGLLAHLAFRVASGAGGALETHRQPRSARGSRFAVAKAVSVGAMPFHVRGRSARRAAGPQVRDGLPPGEGARRARSARPRDGLPPPERIGVGRTKEIVAVREDRHETPHRRKGEIAGLGTASEGALVWPHPPRRLQPPGAACPLITARKSLDISNRSPSGPP